MSTLLRGLRAAMSERSTTAGHQLSQNVDLDGDDQSVHGRHCGSLAVVLSALLRKSLHMQCDFTAVRQTLPSPPI